MLVVVSQSGESAEVVRLAERVAGRADRPFMVSVTNGADNTLARASDVALDTGAGDEVGPSTLTYCASLVVLSGLASVLAGEPAHEVADRLEVEAEMAAIALEALIANAKLQAKGLRNWLGNRPSVIVLARGAARAAAEMGALTLKEAARLPAEAIETAQFRHGPLELAGPGAAVIVIATEDPTREFDMRLGRELVDAGAAVILITTGSEGLEGARVFPIAKVDRGLASAAAIVPIQLLAWQLALDRGYSPGSYTVATKVTKRE
jgi:glucosamine--fructose-6-phosphate aminotransferase (isomerizing)